MDRSSITRLMYGDHLLTHNVLIALADALGVDAAEVLRVAGGSRVGEVTGRVAYIAEQLQQLVDEAPEERGAEILDTFEAMVRLLRGK